MKIKEDSREKLMFWSLIGSDKCSGAKLFPIFVVDEIIGYQYLFLLPSYNFLAGK